MSRAWHTSQSPSFCALQSGPGSETGCVRVAPLRLWNCLFLRPPEELLWAQPGHVPAGLPPAEPPVFHVIPQKPLQPGLGLHSRLTPGSGVTVGRSLSPLHLSVPKTKWGSRPSSESL